MNKQTFQELRHECAKKYSPKDWTTNLWADFFGDCMKIAAFNETEKAEAVDETEKAEAVDEVSKCYTVPKETVENTVKFIKDNFVV